MCFSASASFIAGASLSAIGVAALKQTKTKSERPLAMIPLLFGIQQLTEGVIWLTFRHHAPLLKEAMTFVYSAFSHAFWPIYIPFAIGVLEAVRWRKRTLFVLQAAVRGRKGDLFRFPGGRVGGGIFPGLCLYRPPPRG